MRFAPTLESRRVVADGPDDGSIIECFGQSFRWDPASGHQTIDELEPLRLLGDGPMCASPGVLLGLTGRREVRLKLHKVRQNPRLVQAALFQEIAEVRISRFHLAQGLKPLGR